MALSRTFYFYSYDMLHAGVVEAACPITSRARYTGREKPVTVALKRRVA